MAMFKAFKPEAMNKIANAMGYSGDMNQFQQYIEQDPAKQARMNMFKEAAVQMAKGGYAKNKKVKYFSNGGGTGGDGADDFANFYQVPYGSGKEMDYRRVYFGSSQDTMENRQKAGNLPPRMEGGKPIPKAVNYDEFMIQYNKDLAALQGRPDPYAAEQAAAEQAAADTQAAADAQAAAQAQAAAEAQQAAAAQQQYSQQVAAQMQNQSGTMPIYADGTIGTPGTPADYSGMTYEHALMRQMQRDIKSPEEQRAISIALRRGPMEGGDKTPVFDNSSSSSPAPYQPSLPPIYQAPYLSGTHFTPVGQYVQDPTTGQPVAQAYNPLNQGYGAAAANFQQQIQGGYGTPERTVVPLGGFGGIQGNVSYNPNTASAIGNLAGSMLTQNKAQGGYIKPQKFAVGGTVTNPSGTQAGTPVVTGASTPVDGQPAIGQFTVEQMYTPGVPVGGTTIAAQTQQNAQQDIAAGTGTLTGSVAVPTATAAASQAQNITPSQANTMQAAQAAPAVDAAMQATQAAQANPQDPRAQVTAAQQTASSVGNLQAAQGNASLINNPVQRQIQQGELISGVADAATASAFTAQVQAAQATPTQQATVQGQLDGLMQQFQGGATPSWAAGAMRAATAAMAARGLGASSLAGQAIVQAAMESALPIAQADAATQAQFEGQNLSNRQQRAMLAAQQRAQFMGQEFDQAFQSRVQNSARIGDIANMNFTAEQQVQLENSRATNTMNLNNLSNSQAMVMAEAAALSQLDTQNLNNRQQTAVQNAQSFLQTDMANLSNRQQTDLFKAQQRTQSMFTDQAAKNAAAQFNASSENQVDQFFQQLGSQVSQFNATQANAQAQYNAGQTNTVNRFNAELNNQRDQYNAQNQMVIAQSNAQWRRQIATADTAAVNRANELNANAILDISKQAYSNLWNFYGDTMEWAWTSAEKELDRYSAMAIAELDAATSAAASAAASNSAAGNAIGSLIGTIGSALITCWVAREVYGKGNPEWFIFRTWLQYDAPKWFKKLYVTHGENYAKLIAKVPPLKWATKQLMDMVVNKKRRKHNVQTV